MTNTALTSDFSALASARALWKSGAVEQGLAAYAAAVRERPDNVRGLLEAARALALDFRNRQAELLVERAEALGQNDFAILLTVAETYQIIDRPSQARRLFEELEKGHKLAGPQLLSLATLLEFHGEVDLAWNAVQRCMHDSPTRLEPLLSAARLQRRRGETEEARRFLQSILSAPIATQPILAIRAHYEMAALHDSERNYALAAEHLLSAKQMQSLTPGFEEKRAFAKRLNSQLSNFYSGDSLDRLLEHIGPQDFAIASDSAPAHAFLMGFPRSGTTLLEQSLAAHPMVASLSETPLFTRYVIPSLRDGRSGEIFNLATLSELNASSRSRLQTSYLGRAEEVLGGSLNGRLLLDKNPNLTSLAAAAIGVFPSCRLILALRDPRDVVLSCYFQFFALTEFSTQFATIADAADAYQSDMKIALCLAERASSHAAFSRYEDLVADHAAELHRVAAFLRLPWSDEITNYRNALRNKALNSPTHAEVRKPIHQGAVGRWGNYIMLLEPCLERLGILASRLGYP